MKIDVFTDGACSKNGQVGACASWACWFPEHKDISTAERVPDEDLQTNQRGELMAILKAIEILEYKFDESISEIDLKVYTDSTYAKNCLTVWTPSWVKNNWKNSQGNLVSHKDIIEATYHKLKKFKSYTITYVKAHTGKDDYESRNNDIVDKMAVKVISKDEDVFSPILTNTKVAIQGSPLQLMGPPVSEQDLIKWCVENTDKLDKDSYHSALVSVLTKTLKKKGFAVVKQRLHRETQYRLKTDSGLIKERVIVKKEE